MFFFLRELSVCCWCYCSLPSIPSVCLGLHSDRDEISQTQEEAFFFVSAWLTG